ncbi:hypothetical protein HF289_08805 [Acidithiobacillus ferrooxidans]|jgi:hypothetical protein|uniref:hypothetical protein n=1 Tax=Acidithiobacillus ferrooxidans TaxID=920 RepID=UPI0013D130E8|nr:hypothetical protein [Acidithiobacillus ferrooxidans]MBU2856970.1 hypothetical protein [Acidithiobacillus ferrooxidans]MBU2860255.1 hypothetical protein [Acidithiobacillus ferrooxidans]MCR2832171.1 hypothetical protein [Acidithiobacillus ferrooxidans]
MTNILRLITIVLALAVPVMARCAPATQMESFYDCILPPTLAVYHDAVVASGHMATDVSFFKNKNPGASFDETSWLYALYAKKNLSQCKIPTDSADVKKSQSIVNAARDIINGYIAFTWSPTPMSLAKEWPQIRTGYDSIRASIGNEYYRVSVPEGVIKTDGKYEAMIHMQMGLMH